MTHQQLLSFGILAGAMFLFLWGRIRYDLVALLALLASVACGTVDPKKAFTGFSDDIVIIVGSALVISAAVARSGMVEFLLQVIASRIRGVAAEVTLLAGSVAFLSALVKNIGALAMLMPAAMKTARKSNVSPSLFLMPMSFGSLLGGLITMIGTSPNIIVSRVREQETGAPFRMFDYAPVGLGLTLVGLVFLHFGYRLLPRDRRAAPTLGEALDIQDYTTSVEIPEDSKWIGQTVSAFQQDHEGEVRVTLLLRGPGEREKLTGVEAVIQQGDVLLLKGDPEALERAIAKDGLLLEGQHRTLVTENSSDSIGVIEAVVASGSILARSSIGKLALHEIHGVNLLAISRAGQRITEGLRDVRLKEGDVIVLQGELDALPEQLRALGCLPLAQREIALGSVRKGLVPLVILCIAMGAAALGFIPASIAFLAAAVAVILVKALPVRSAYQAVEWPILVMLGALIPVSEAVQTSGGTELISAWLSQAASGLPPWAAVGLILIAAMAATPFLNNAATVLVMGPIAATFAMDLGMAPDAFLMAVAVGAGCDFLTPIGHQCNTLVMGPGGYRFGDYARLGVPLSLLVILTGVPLILFFWPV